MPTNMPTNENMPNKKDLDVFKKDRLRVYGTWLSKLLSVVVADYCIKRKWLTVWLTGWLVDYVGDVVGEVFFPLQNREKIGLKKLGV